MNSLSHNDRVNAALMWLNKESTRKLVHNASKEEILEARYDCNKSVIETYGPLLTSFQQLGQYYLVKFIYDSQKGIELLADSYLGYFLIQTNCLLRLSLVDYIAKHFKGGKRKQALSGPIYTPFPRQEDALCLLLSISANHDCFKSLYEKIIFNINNFSGEIKLPPSELPVVSFSIKLYQMWSERRKVNINKEMTNADPYFAIMENISSDGNWDSAFSAFCDYCEAQSNPYHPSDQPEYSIYPFQIYPVAPLATIATRQKFRPQASLPDSFVSRLIEFDRDGFLEKNEIYQASRRIILNGLPNFRFP